MSDPRYPTVTRVCEVCGNTYRNTNLRVCSTDCNRQRILKLDRIELYTCVNCGKEGKRSKLSPERKYCSNHCMTEYRRKDSVPHTCGHCGKSFLVLRGYVDARKRYGKNPHQYCSNECRRAVTHNSIYVNCAVCAKSFLRPLHRRRNRTRFFCSYICMGKGRNIGRLGSDLPCTQCGTIIYIAKLRLENNKDHFCSNACRLLYQYKISPEIWQKKVISSRPYQMMRDRIAHSNQGLLWKKAVLDRDIRCTKCTSDKYLQVHHIVPISQILYNNEFREERVLQDPLFLNPTNGIVLCAPCHALEHHHQTFGVGQSPSNWGPENIGLIAGTPLDLW
jgi:5-methylcytosine-specific restriction endonuclease McrA